MVVLTVKSDECVGCRRRDLYGTRRHQNYSQHCAKNGRVKARNRTRSYKTTKSWACVSDEWKCSILSKNSFGVLALR